VDSGFDGATLILECSHGIAINFQPADGVFGLVEVGEIPLTPDRSIAIDNGVYSGIVQSLMTGLGTHVREEIDKLEQFGSIPARYSFLQAVVRRYGPEVVAASTLRWIPTLEQPGNLIHRSRIELKQLLESESSVVVCSGMTPSKAYDLAAQQLEAQELSRSIAILLPINEFEVGYKLKDRIEVEEGSTRLRGEFGQIIAKINDNGGQFRMLRLVLDLVAEAWCTTRTSLEGQHWEMDADFLRAYLWVNLKRIPAQL
jgi:hypothetical protein